MSASPAAPAIGDHAGGRPTATLLWLVTALVAGAAAAAGAAPVLALTLLLAVACAVGVLHSPFIFVWTLTALSGIGFGFDHQEALRLGDIPIRINGLRWTLVTVTSVLILWRLQGAPIPRLLRAWLALVLIAAAGILWSTVPVEGLKQLLLYVAPLLMAMVMTLAITREHQIHELRSAMFLAAAVGATIGLAPLLAGGYLGATLDEGGRPLHRSFGTFLLPVLALTLARLHHRPDLRHAAFTVVIFALAVLTLSRTTLGAMVLLGAVLVVMGPLRLKVAVGVLLTAFTIAALSWEPVSERIFSDSRTGFTGRVEIIGTGTEAQIQAGGLNTSGRGFVWLQTAMSGMASPWRGQGTGSATEFVTRITAGEAVFPHNEYLRTFHDLGVAGLAVTLAVFLVPIVGFARLHRRSTRPLARELALAALLAWLGFAIVSAFDNSLLYFTFFTHNVFLVSVLAVRAEELR